MMVGHKALLPVAGEPMVLRPLRALLESPEIAEIIVLTQDPADLRPVIPDQPNIKLRASGTTIAGTIADFIAEDAARFPLLVTTADHALLNAQMIAEFTRQARGADLAIGLVERRGLLKRFPNAKRTWIGFRGGRYSGANLFALGSDRVLPAIERWRSVERDRKKGWRVLSALGPALLLGAVLKLRTLQQTARAIGRRLGIDVRAVEMTNPLAAVDVDKQEDHALVEAILAGRA
jgi:GTP:adenosylcobinamide-phosphate guanylyltransferase